MFLDLQEWHLPTQNVGCILISPPWACQFAPAKRQPPAGQHFEKPMSTLPQMSLKGKANSTEVLSLHFTFRALVWGEWEPSSVTNRLKLRETHLFHEEARFPERSWELTVGLRESKRIYIAELAFPLLHVNKSQPPLGGPPTLTVPAHIGQLDGDLTRRFAIEGSSHPGFLFGAFIILF